MSEPLSGAWSRELALLGHEFAHPALMQQGSSKNAAYAGHSAAGTSAAGQWRCSGKSSARERGRDLPAVTARAGAAVMHASTAAARGGATHAGEA
jgi:hypothetical protein